MKSIPFTIARSKEEAFFGCELCQFEFQANSKQTFFDKYIFNETEIKTVTIPKSITQLNKGWRAGTVLECVDVELHVKKHEIFIVGKSVEKSDVYDVLHCAPRDIKIVNTPSFIRVIDTLVFAQRDIVNAIIPSSVRFILPFAFWGSQSLQKVVFSMDSEIQIIGRFALFNTSIESITIPSSAASFRSGWCGSPPSFKEFKILESEVKNIAIFGDNEDEKYVVFKNNHLQDEYDTLLFAKRNIVRAKVPSFIKKILSASFENCFSIEKVEFSEDSQLKIIYEHVFNNTSLTEIEIPSSVRKISCSVFFSIDKFAFRGSFVDNIVIPASVTEINMNAFEKCNNLHKISFEKNSKLAKIESYLFLRSAIEKVRIPSCVNAISRGAFEECVNLQSIEFSEDSNLRVIEDNAFLLSNLSNIETPARFSFFEKKLVQGFFGTQKHLCPS